MNKGEIIYAIESELNLHEGKVYVPINRQILEEIVRSLKEEQETKPTAKRTTKRTVKKN